MRNEPTMTWKQYPAKRLHKTHDMESLMDIAKHAVESKLNESKALQSSESKVPQFAHDEIKLGRFLGKGGFCTVNEISKVMLDDEGDSAATLLIESSTSRTLPGYELYLGPESPMSPKSYHHELTESTRRTTSNLPKEPVQDRAFMSSQYRRGRRKGCRYALKRVTVTKTTDAGTFVNAVVDLAVEAKFLSVVRHPNIIKMRATSFSDPFDSESSHFIVLDRLYEILGERITTWRNRKNSVVGKLISCHNKNREEQLLVERLTVARDISSALTYLHGRNIVFRDIKPENIGFDVRGDVKIFDFGLAREFDRSQGNKDGTYNLTGDTGSPRYMAPEVALSKPYNASADVYSFTILFWEMMQLQTPFEGYTMRKFQERVVHRGIRPKCDPEWPLSLKKVMQHGWSSNIAKRPSMSSFTAALHHEIQQHETVLPKTNTPEGSLGLLCKAESFDDNASRKSELSYIRIKDGLLSP